MLIGLYRKYKNYEVICVIVNINGHNFDLVIKKLLGSPVDEWEDFIIDGICRFDKTMADENYYNDTNYNTKYLKIKIDRQNLLYLVENSPQYKYMLI